MDSFQLVGLSAEPFAPLFALTDLELAEMGALRVVANEPAGYPCRVSLVDAEVGEELLLLPYCHQPAKSPYNASGPIYIRKGAQRQILDVGHIPEYVGRRLISVRAYDAEHMMIGADVCNGPTLATEIERQFSNAQVRYLHLHNAKRGCYSCLVERV
ncbi:MAG: DUF1203 domain-containing protein [Betaproteobacteria bacterium]